MKHSTEFEALVDDAKSRVREVSVEETVKPMKDGAKLIDVREDNEWGAGHAKDAVHLGRGIIERDIVSEFPEKDAELILYCGGGYRSVLAADNLQKMGYTNAFSMAGGWKAWKEAGARTEAAPYHDQLNNALLSAKFSLRLSHTQSHNSKTDSSTTE